MTDTEFLDELTSALSQHFKGKIEFEAEVVTSFPIGPNGKSRSIVDETK
jgi:hypothetical protein